MTSSAVTTAAAATNVITEALYFENTNLGTKTITLTNMLISGYGTGVEMVGRASPTDPRLSLVLQKVLTRRVPLLKFFLKRELIYVPVIGLAWWALDFPFMQRKGGNSGPRDLERARKACEKFRVVPTSVITLVLIPRLCTTASCTSTRSCRCATGCTTRSSST